MEDKHRSSQTRLRDRLPFTPRREPQFRWRGNECRASRDSPTRFSRSP